MGLGAAIMLVIYSTLPLAEYTPAAAIGLGLLLGILVAFLGRRRGRAEPVEA
jgi:ABC-type Fe3+-siderophore transport system permease subunit